MRNYIGVIDCNNFFVSCERLFRPDLLKRPVIVLSSNDGCVVARSQEIKDMGIPMGVPYFQIKDSLKDNEVAVFSSNFTLYRDISRRVFGVVKELLTNFEPYSIDEGFFSVDGASAQNIALELRERVGQAVGIPVSVGIAPSKTLAKWANGRAKKSGGVYMLRNEAWQTMSSQVTLGELWGVGGRGAQAYAAHGVTTAADLIAADPARVARLFGVAGVRLRAELLGQAAYAIQNQQGTKQSIASSRSFERSTQALAVVQDAVAYHVRQAVSGLRRQGLCASKMTVTICSSRYEQNGPGYAVREIELLAPSDDVFVFLRHATQVVEILFASGVAYKKAGVVLSGFTPTSFVYQGLFDTPNAATAQVAAVVEALNVRQGGALVTIGSHLKESKWSTRRETLSPAYTTRWSALRIVQA